LLAEIEMRAAPSSAVALQAHLARQARVDLDGFKAYNVLFGQPAQGRLLTRWPASEPASSAPATPTTPSRPRGATPPLATQSTQSTSLVVTPGGGFLTALSF